MTRAKLFYYSSKKGLICKCNLVLPSNGNSRAILESLSLKLLYVICLFFLLISLKIAKSPDNARLFTFNFPLKALMLILSIYHFSEDLF